VLRQRIHEGRLNKAHRGEVFTHAPVGYVRQPSGELAIDPDQQLQSVVRLLFEEFEELGTVNAVLRYLLTKQVGIPVTAPSIHGNDRAADRRPGGIRD